MHASASEHASRLSSAIASLVELPPLPSGSDDALLCDRYMQIGGTLARVLRASFGLYRAVGSNGATTSMDVDALSMHPSATLAPTAEQLLYERVADITRRALDRWDRAAVTAGGDECGEASGIEAGEASEQDESLALVGGPPTMNELGELTALARVNSFASAVRTTTRRSGGKSFRDAYMALLADGAADELDALRCEQPPMTEAELRTLLDALESGCASFGGTERALLMATFVGKRSWWEQRASEARRPAAASAAKTKKAARKRRGAAPESGDKWGDMSSSEDEGAADSTENGALPQLASRMRALSARSPAKQQ